MSDKAIIYVDLESILDLREGFLLSRGIPQKEVVDYIINGDYNFRNSDNFKWFEPGEYQRAIDAGDKYILLNSMINFVPPDIINRIALATVKTSLESANQRVEIWVNIYPFKLDTNEQQSIIDAFHKRLNQDVFMKAVYIEPKDLSPEFIYGFKPNAMYIYNYREWMRHHAETVVNFQNKDTQFFFAKLYEVEPTEEQLEEAKLDGFTTLFEYHRFSLALFMQVRFFPIILYTNAVLVKPVIEKLNNDFKERWDKEQEENDKNIGDIDEYINENISER